MAKKRFHGFVRRWRWALIFVPAAWILISIINGDLNWIAVISATIFVYACLALWSWRDQRRSP